MPTNDEVQRLTAVYRHYRESGISDSRWSWANPGMQAMVRERTRVLEQLLRGERLLPLTSRRILDLGCGSGRELAGFLRWGAEPANLHGVDLLPDRIAAAKRDYPALHFQQGNAEQLQAADRSFDLVLLFTVFTSILDDRMAAGVAGEVNRVLKPGGAIVWYDFRYNNPRNPNVRGMTRTRIQTLFPGFEQRLRAVTLLPPLARSLRGMATTLYPIAAMLPFLRTHYLGLLIKRS